MYNKQVDRPKSTWAARGGQNITKYRYNSIKTCQKPPPPPGARARAQGGGGGGFWQVFIEFYRYFCNMLATPGSSGWFGPIKLFFVHQPALTWGLPHVGKWQPKGQPKEKYTEFWANMFVFFGWFCPILSPRMVEFEFVFPICLDEFSW